VLWHGLRTVPHRLTAGLLSPSGDSPLENYRIQKDSAVYFVTYSVVDWLPVFVSESANRILTESLSFCCQKKGLCVNAYVIMPTHLHTIVFDKKFESEHLQETLHDFRKFTGRSLSDFCSRNGPPCFTMTMSAAAGEDRTRRFWQPTRHPEAIVTERFWQQKLDYLHDNPCRKGLVREPAHWRFSSAAYYFSDGAQECEVPISPICW
jgi:REP element-mobilizing transposase RayT